MALYETAYSISDVVQAVIELEEDEANAKNVTLSYRVEEDVPECLLGDGGRIGQVLSKLVSNAVGFKSDSMKETKVEILVSVRKESYAHVLEIRVCDRGKVLPEYALKLFTDYFSRGILYLREREDNGDFSLSIVDLFVRQMQGKVSVTSKETEGTVFLIELPQLEVTES